MKLSLLTAIFFLLASCKVIDSSNNELSGNRSVQNAKDKRRGEQKISKAKNPEYHLGNYAMQVFSFGPKSKKELEALMNKEGKPEVTKVEVRDFTMSRGANGGETIIASNLKDGYLVGPSGMGPCSGVIVSSPDHSQIWAFHFGPTDNIKGTLSKYKFPRGSNVIVAGSHSYEKPSMVNLQAIQKYFASDYYGRTGYVNTTGIWVDNKGRYFVHNVEVRKDKEY